MEESTLNRFVVAEVNVAGECNHSWVTAVGDSLVLFCGKWMFVYGLGGSRKNVLDVGMWLYGTSEDRQVRASKQNGAFCVSTMRASNTEFDLHVSVSNQGQLVAEYSQARCAICDETPKDEKRLLRCRKINERTFEIFVLASEYPSVEVCKERCLPASVGESVVCFTANAENGRMAVSLSDTRKVSGIKAFRTNIYSTYASATAVEKEKSIIERTTDFCFLSVIGPDWDPRKVNFVPYKPRRPSPKETAKKDRSWRLGTNKKKYLEKKK